MTIPLGAYPRRIILLGFKSDIGYAIMVLTIASLAVFLAVVQISSIFPIFLVLTAVFSPGPSGYLNS